MFLTMLTIQVFYANIEIMILLIIKYIIRTHMQWYKI